MDPLSAPLHEDDLRAPDFPLPGEINDLSRELIAAQDDTPPNTDSDDWIVGDWFRPQPGRPLHATRCISIARSTGERCKQWSVIGFTRCPKHLRWGTLAHIPQYRERVLERARLDLLRTAPYAIETLAEMVTDKDINPSVRLKASLEVLDRVGIRGGSELSIDANVTVEEVDPATEVRQRLERLKNATTSAALLDGTRAAALKDVSESEIIEAEVVDE